MFEKETTEIVFKVFHHSPEEVEGIKKPINYHSWQFDQYFNGAYLELYNSTSMLG
jgi:hypothetical protein